MGEAERAWLIRSRWIEYFNGHVAVASPDAPMHRLTAHAARLRANLGQLEPRWRVRRT